METSNGNFATRTGRRAPMVTERERATFLATSPALERITVESRWELARIGTDEHLDGRTVLDRAADDRVLVVRGGELLVVDRREQPGSWVDEDGITRDRLGDRVPVDPVTGGRVVGRLTEGDVLGCAVLERLELDGCVLRTGTLGTDVIAWDPVEFHLELARSVLACVELANLEPSAEVDVRRMGLYNDLPMRDLALVMRDALQQSFRPGDAIVEQGAHGDRFHVLLHGAAIVERDGDVIGRLGRGDHFGELALLREAPRAATVRATAATVTWSVTRAAFERIVRHRLAPRADAATRHLADGIGPGGAWGSPLATRLRASGD